VGDALDARDRMQNNALRRRQLEGQVADEAVARETATGRRTAFTDAMASNEHDMSTVPAAEFGGGPPAPKKRTPWEAAEVASQSMFARGDVEGATKYLSQAASLKTFATQQALASAFSTQDPKAVSDVANQYVAGGAKFDGARDADGSIIGSITFPNGQVVRQRYPDFRSFAGATQQVLNPGDIQQLNENEAKKSLETLKAQAEARLKNAQADNYSASASESRGMLPGKIQAQEAGLGLLGAQTAQAYASASRTADEKRTPLQKNLEYLIGRGVDEETAMSIATNTYMKGKSREEKIIDLAGRMRSAEMGGTFPVNRPMPEIMKDASQAIDMAAEHAGDARMGSGSPKTSGRRAPGLGLGGKAPQLDNSEMRRASEIRAAVRAGQMSRADAEQELKALGFE